MQDPEVLEEFKLEADEMLNEKEVITLSLINLLTLTITCNNKEKRV